MSEKTAYLSLGSNIEQEQNLRLAIGELAACGCAITRVSSFYERASGSAGAAMVLELRCAGGNTFRPFMLLRALRENETKMGSKKLGPRDRG